MTVYIVNALIIGIVTRRLYTYYDDYGIEEAWSIRKKKNALSVVFVILVAMYALRGVTGTDAGNYYMGYTRAYTSVASLSELLSSYRDKLYQLLVFVIGRVSHGNWPAMCLSTGVIIYYPIIKLIREKSADVQLSVLVFLMSLDAYFGYNGVRQMLATSLSIYAFYFFLKERKYIKYIILMLAATGFHAGILFVVPFHFIGTRKLQSNITKIVLVAMIGASFAFERVWNYFFTVFSDNTVIEKYSDLLVDAHGSGILRILVLAAPVLLAFMRYRELRARYEDIDADIILSIFSVLFMVYSTISASFSQMCIFFTIANVILISKVIESFVNTRLSLRTVTIVLYFINMVLLLKHGDMGLNPYTPIWNMHLLK